MKRRLIGIAVGLVFVGSLAYVGLLLPPKENLLGSYVTSIKERAESQKYNVNLACRRLDNTVILPGQTFSFLKKVGSWTADQGYVKAPVSYDGELVRSYGGGVCQASSTLYNAALLAGLDIVQRERHHFAPHYVPPGRDAAVAYEEIDLKIHNNLPEAIRIRASVDNGNVNCRILSAYKPDYRVYVNSMVKSITKPLEIIQDRSVDSSGRRKLVNRGHTGFHVATYRTIVYPQRTIRQLISEDRYPAMDRVVRIVKR
jgi:vancomycin resistance protein YoaR